MLVCVYVCVSIPENAKRKEEKAKILPLDCCVKYHPPPIHPVLLIMNFSFFVLLRPPLNHIVHVENKLCVIDVDE